MLWIVIGAICLVVFVISAYMFISNFLEAQRSAQAFDDLSSQVAESDLNQEFTKYDALYEQNHDLFGWLKIDGTVVDYPVMYTPNDPEYYLRRAFDGSSSQNGVPFLDYRYQPGGANYLIYGHHMQDGSMFGSIPQYSEESYWREHPIIHFDTVEEPGDYEVLGAFYSQIYDGSDPNAFQYYNYMDLSDPQKFDEYVQKVKAASVYDTGVTASYGDQLLTLSTCEYHVDNGRFVVVAKKVS